MVKPLPFLCSTSSGRLEKQSSHLLTLQQTAAARNVRGIDCLAKSFLRESGMDRTEETCLRCLSSMTIRPRSSPMPARSVESNGPRTYSASSHLETHLPLPASLPVHIYAVSQLVP